MRDNRVGVRMREFKVFRAQLRNDEKAFFRRETAGRVPV